MWLLPLVLIIPNIILDITDYGNWLEKVVNILLPAGAYLLLVSISRNVGRTVLLMFPLIFYAAFQIVLLYLYGESIIAVDMFLNLVTTNVSEATELLGNLSMAIVTVIILYLSPVIWAIALVWSKTFAPADALRRARRIALAIASAGIVSLIAAYILVPRFDIVRDVFPANVVNNTLTAIRRTAATNDYYRTSSSFSHNAASTRPSDLREVYVLVIGETSRADNWQLAGYERPTNPRLSRRSSLIFFDKALSQSNTTHKSVPLLMSHLSVDNFGDSIYHSKGVISAFNEAGYRTAYLSNQARNHSFIDFFAREAQTLEYIGDDGASHYDIELVPRLEKFLKDSPSNKMFVVLHTYGSHFNYPDRYPAERRVFTPAEATSANRENRDQLVNAYDNTIAFTDLMLDSVMGCLERLDCPSALIYLSDHGEDIFDDERARFLHASPVPTYYQIHVPLILWTSSSYNSTFPAAMSNAGRHQHANIASNDIVFHTLLELAGISAARIDPSKSLIDTAYHDRPRVYLNDYNESVSLKASGLRSYDFEKLYQSGISTK